MTDARLATLTALVDTLAPGVERAEDDEEARAFFARSGSDLGLPALLAGIVAPRHEPLLAALETHGFAGLDLEARTRVFHELAAGGGATRQLLRELKGATLSLFYALTDAEGRNPNWPALGYPGPNSPPPTAEQAPKTIRTLTPLGAGERLRADVCIVGSGAGGGVIAAELQRAGLSVIVLERGGYRNEADFRQLEAVGAQELYLRGGLFFSESGSVGLLAGATLGGGTVVNSLVCLRPPVSAASGRRSGSRGSTAPSSTVTWMPSPSGSTSIRPPRSRTGRTRCWWRRSTGGGSRTSSFPATPPLTTTRATAATATPGASTAASSRR
jgi:GMC oxidoreductase